MENFLRGHLGAFEAWSGLPRVLLYDNLKSAVLERQGDAIRFHPTLLSFAGHYRYEPRPVAVARGNEKGRVERAIRYVRESFFAARAFADLDDLNAQAEHWCIGQAADRPCPEDTTISVRDAFAAEQPRLLGLPENPYPTDEQLEVRAGKTPYVRFDLNDYSIPHTHVQRMLTVRADPVRVRVLDGGEILADHPRSYDRKAQVEDPTHIGTLVEHKRRARQHRGIDRLAKAAPSSRDLLIRARRRRVAGGHPRCAGQWGATPERGASGAGAPARGAQRRAASRSLSAAARKTERHPGTAPPARHLRRPHGRAR